MFDKIRFKNEPVLWVIALMAILDVVRVYLSKGPDIQMALDAAVAAVGALIVRRAVTPSGNVPPELVEPVEGLEEVSQDPDFWDDEEALDDQPE